VAMARAKREPWKFGGRGIAIAGLALCITSLVMVVPVGIIASIAIPNLLAARRAANEGSAVYTVRQIASAEATYQSSFKKVGTLEELAANNLIDPRLSTGEKNGYQFSISVTGPDTFEVNAVPTVYRSSGLRSFYTDETLVIRGGDNYGGPSSKMDEPLDGDYDYSPTRERRVDYRNNRRY
jgi:type IV pilus assembly protein PilA